MTNVSSRSLSTFLIVSIAINLILAGIVFGYLIGNNQSRPFPPHLNWLMDSVAEQNQEKIRSLIRENAKKIRPLRRQMRLAHQALESALIVDPMDDAAIDAALKTLEINGATLQANMLLQLVSIMKTLPTEDRKQALKRFRHRKRHGDHHIGPP